MTREELAHKRLFRQSKAKKPVQGTLGIEPDDFPNLTPRMQEWRTYFIRQYIANNHEGYAPTTPFDFDRFVGYFRFEHWLDRRLNHKLGDWD